MTTLHKAVEKSRGIFFDFFHTLSSIEGTHDVLPPGNHEILGFDREAWQREWDLTIPGRMIGLMRDSIEIIARPARALNPDIESWRIEKAARTRAEKFAVAVRNIEPAVIQTLAALRRRGKKLALISNADVVEIAAWPDSPIRDLFDHVVFSCHAGVAKPEPGIYLHACNATGLAPEECMFVGDGGSDELRGARELGMFAVQQTGIASRLWPDRVRRAGRDAHFHIDHVAALLPQE